MMFQAWLVSWTIVRQIADISAVMKFLPPAMGVSCAGLSFFVLTAHSCEFVQLFLFALRRCRLLCRQAADMRRDVSAESESGDLLEEGLAANAAVRLCKSIGGAIQHGILCSMLAFLVVVSCHVQQICRVHSPACDPKTPDIFIMRAMLLLFGFVVICMCCIEGYVAKSSSVPLLYVHGTMRS
jgi:hypothetical protein